MGGPWEDYAPPATVDTPPGVPRLRVTPAGPPVASDGPWIDYQQRPEANWMGMSGGLYKAADAGIAHGLAGLIGLPSAVGNLGSMGIDKLTQTIDNLRGVPEADRYKPPEKSLLDLLPTTESASNMFQKAFYGGEKPYEPQNNYERYVKGGAEFIPGAMMGPGGVIGNAVRYGALPGLASTGVGDIPGVAGSKIETPLKVGAAILTSGLGLWHLDPARRRNRSGNPCRQASPNRWLIRPTR